jgi:DNA polymerase III subunit delta
MARKQSAAPPLIVVFGDEQHQKSTALTASLDALLPPEVDRSLALTEYDGTRPPDAGGPALVTVLEDLATLPFLADRRVVVIRDADAFVTANRERLEAYFAKPAPTGTLVLECRTFLRTTRLAKAGVAVGAQYIECKKLAGRALVDFVVNAASERGKRLAPAVAARIVDLVGPDTGWLGGEVEKLALYAADRPGIDDEDVSALVGQSREERIFAVMDVAANGRTADALRMWHQVIACDPDAPYKVIGGMLFKVRQWLLAHRLLAEGTPLAGIAPRVGAWGRERELSDLLRRLTPPFLRRFLAALANLDSQAKSGTRSIETGVELMLLRLAAAAR